MESYRTIAGRASAEIEEKKSRFIASVAHVETEADALAFLEEVRAANRMARHNVYAYVLRSADGVAGVASAPANAEGAPFAKGVAAAVPAAAGVSAGGSDGARLAGGGERVRYSDDGEPQKTAGLPTLEVVRHAGLTDIVVVVTRYFGGVLLGTGGLVRAYTQATQAGIEAAEIVTVSRCVDVRVRMEYPFYEQVRRLAADCGAKTVDTQFTDEVMLNLRLLEGTQGRLLTALSELMSGRERVEVSAPFDAAF